MKRWIHAATGTNDGWKHSYDSERSCSFDSKEFDDGVANIRSFDNDGDWGYSLTLEFDNGKTISKSEYGEGSLQRLKDYAEDQFSSAAVQSRTEVCASSKSFDDWYDSLKSADQAKVDDLADDMGLPLYEECSEAELAQLHDSFTSNKGGLS